MRCDVCFLIASVLLRGPLCSDYGGTMGGRVVLTISAFPMKYADQAASVGPKSNTPTVDNLTASCGQEMVAFDHFGPKMLDICLGRVFREYLIPVRGCLGFILVRAPHPSHRFGAS